MPKPQTIQQAAAALGVDANTLRKRATRMRERGLSIGTKHGQTWVYTQAEVRRLAQQGRA